MGLRATQQKLGPSLISEVKVEAVAALDRCQVSAIAPGVPWVYPLRSWWGLSSKSQAATPAAVIAAGLTFSQKGQTLLAWPTNQLLREPSGREMAAVVSDSKDLGSQRGVRTHFLSISEAAKLQTWRC